MSALKRLGAVYLIGVAVVVAVWFIINPFFVDSFEVMNVWRVLNVLMVLALPLALDFNLRRKLRVSAEREPGDAITRRYLEANAAFFLTAVVTVLFLHNWFSLLAFGEDSLNSNYGNHQAWVIWAAVDTLLPIALGVTGCAMWRDAADS